MVISRRTFLKATFAALLTYPSQRIQASSMRDRALNLYNTHTSEKLKIKYFRSGRYDSEALKDINHILRCHYTQEVADIDVRLLDLLCNIKDGFGVEKQIHIVSGYRSPVYNEYLRRNSVGVANNSLHLYGLAIDFFLPGVSMSRLYKVAKSFRGGGVGRYSRFIHIDTGEVRYW